MGNYLILRQVLLYSAETLVLYISNYYILEAYLVMFMFTKQFKYVRMLLWSQTYFIVFSFYRQDKLHKKKDKWLA